MPALLGTDHESRRRTASAVVVLLLTAMVAVAAAPLLMPGTYSVVEHSISESGGQGIADAWLARSAFLLVGFAVLLLARSAAPTWGRLGTAAFQAYGVATIAAGIFAHGPWLEVPFDRVEGYLHTVAAFFAGLGFGIGVLAVGLGRGPGLTWRHALDALALLSVAVLPITMLVFDAQTGIQQRFLALVGFAWMLAETVRIGWGDQAPVRSSAGR